MFVFENAELAQCSPTQATCRFRCGSAGERDIVGRTAAVRWEESVNEEGVQQWPGGVAGVIAFIDDGKSGLEAVQRLSACAPALDALGRRISCRCGSIRSPLRLPPSPRSLHHHQAQSALSTLHNHLTISRTHATHFPVRLETATGGFSTALREAARYVHPSPARPRPSRMPPSFTKLCPLCLPAGPASSVC